MMFGVIFYASVVGTLTSVITEEVLNEEGLTTQLTALDQFSESINMDEQFKHQLSSFLTNNYNEVNFRMDEDDMIK